MKLLTDTNALLWASCAPGRLTEKAKRAINDAEEISFSIVSVREIALKLSKGGFSDLEVPYDWDRKLVTRLQENGYHFIPVMVDHCRRIQDPPFHHKDPFDRIADRPGHRDRPCRHRQRRAVRRLRGKTCLVRGFMDHEHAKRPKRSEVNPRSRIGTKRPPWTPMVPRLTVPRTIPAALRTGIRARPD